MSYETLLYETAEAIATITLNRPERLNTIVPPMPDELEAAVDRATADREVKVIVLRGAGRGFCAGFDFAGGFHHWDEAITSDGAWDPGKDFVMATSRSVGPVPKFMSLWRSPKPVIAQVHGWCVGGGSDMALCADLVIASEDAQIGTPYSRMWGCYLTGMWLYRLGLTRAKEFALTGKPLSGAEAAAAGLINAAVPFERLEDEVRERAELLATIPAAQLAAMKLVVNQAYENMGLGSTQLLGPILDGLMRNTPEARALRRARRARGRRQRGRPSGRPVRRLQPGAAGPQAGPRQRARRGAQGAMTRRRHAASPGWPTSVEVQAGRRRSRSRLAVVGRGPGCRRRSRSRLIVVRPPVGRRHAVAALGPVGADGDDLQPVRASLERAHDLRGHAHDVPLAKLDDAVVELHPPRARDHHVRLLLLAMTVAHGRAEAGRVAKVADPEVLGIELAAGEARLDLGGPLARGVLELLQVLDREVGHGVWTSWFDGWVARMIAETDDR